MMNALRITIFTLIVMVVGLLTSNNAEALLETHQCTFCHSLHGSSSTSSFVPQNSPTNIEVLCLGCHLTANGATAAVQPHRTGEGDAAAGFTGNYYVTCRDCHNIHDNMPNWRQGHSDAADGNDGSAPPGGWVEGTNAKMVGREDPNAITPYAIIQTREADFDKNGIPDRGAGVTVTCDELVQNDCYVRGQRHVIFENIDGSAAGASIHGFADDNEDGVDDTTAIGVASNVSDSGFNMSPWDSVCQMCHSMTANHSLPTNKGTTHNSSRRCTDCHEHGFCFDRGNSCSKWTVPNRDVSVDLVTASPGSLDAGQISTVTVDVTNSSDNVESFRVKYRSDLDGIVGFSTVTDLAPTASTQTSFDWTVVSGGAHTMTATAETLLGELNIANNSGSDIVTVTITHNVAVTSVSVTEPINKGDTATVSVDISNPGNFAETFDVNLVSDLDGALGTLSSGSLTGGASTTLEFSWDTTLSTLGGHTLTVTAVHDDGDGGTDSNPANNTANTSATVAIHDVAITSMTAPATTEQGNVASVDVNIANNSGTGGFSETFNVTLFDNTDDSGHASPIQTLSSGALAAGGTDTLNFSWDTSSASINLHTLEAVADTVLGETNTANNIDTTTADVIVPLIHDVAVDLVTAPALVAQGDSPTVSVDVSNNGQATETFNVTLASDLDGSIQILSSGPLLATGSTTLNFTWDTTSSTLGLHTLTATADTVAGETLTGDNDASTTSTVAVHDVAVTNVTAPASVSLGSLAAVDVDIANQGGFAETFNVTLSSDLDGQLQVLSSGALAASGTTTLNFSWDTTGATPGTHTFTVTADTVAGETDTADNIDATATTEVTSHDVAITSVTAPPSIDEGTTATIDVDIANEGTFSETFNVTLYDNTDDPGHASPIQTLSSGALAASGTTTLNFSWDTNGASIATHTLEAIADTVAGETDIADNTATTTTDVIAPVTHDVAVDLVTAPANVVQGGSPTVSVDISNNGGAAESFNVTLSSDLDGEIQVLSSGVLAAAGSTTLNFTWDTTSATLGEHTLTTVADTVPSETLTADNTGSTTSTVVIHDVAATSVTATALIEKGATDTVSVDIANPGAFPETFDVTLVSSVDGTIGTLSSGALAAGGSTTLDFSWNTTTATLGLHTLTATAAHDGVDGGTDAVSGNNSANTAATVAVHDVAVTLVTAPASTSQGNVAAVDVDISNPGGFPETFNVTLVSDLDGSIQTLSSGLLAAGGSTTLNFSWNTTGGTINTHILTATATHAGDGGTDVNSGNNAANTSSAISVASYTNDLAITSIVTNPAGPVINTCGSMLNPIVITVTVKNEGTADQPSVAVDINSDNIDDPGPPLQQLGAVASGASASVNFNWLFAGNDDCGTRTWTAIVDPTNTIGDEDLADNTDTYVVIIPGDHDVMVNSVTVPDPASLGSAETVAVEVYNGHDTAENYNVALVSDVDGAIQTINTGSLAAGTSTILNFSWTPANTGAHTLTATWTHDGGDGGSDVNTVNNSANTTTTVTASSVHDVAVTSVTATATIEQGATDTVNVDINNPGTQSENIDVQLVSDLDGVIQTINTGTLGASGSTTLNFSWDTTSSTLGLHTLTATWTHDTGDGGSDTVPGNNASNTTATVAIHDVAVTTVTAPASTDQGLIAAVDVDISNPGGYAENIDVTLVSDLNGSIQTINTGSLGAGGSTTLNFSWDTTGFDIDTHTLTATWTHDTGDGGTDSVANNSANTASVVAAPANHDVGVVQIQTVGNVEQGTIEVVQVDVWNYGDVAETFDVTLSSSQDGTADINSPQSVVALASGTGTTVSFNWITDGGTSVGAHTLTAATTLGGDSNGGNNSDTDAATILEHDVEVTSITDTPDPVTISGSVTVTVDVTNLGDYAETFNVTLYDTTDDPGHTTPIAGGAQSSGSLTAGGGTTQLIFNWDTTGVSTVTHTLTAVADTVANEFSTGNNSATTTNQVDAPANHDVAATSVTVASLVEQGTAETVSVDISNPGTFTETFDVTLVSSVDGAIQTLSSGSLGPSGSTTLNFSWTPVSLGLHTLTATAAHDGGDGGTDSNAGNDAANNTSTVAIHDVSVTLVTAPASTTQGGTAAVDVDISNLGGFTENINVTLVSDLDGPIQTINTGTLGASGSTTLNFSWDTTGASIATHTLTATWTHDGTDGGTDANSGNNAANTTSEVTGGATVHDVGVVSVAPAPNNVKLKANGTPTNVAVTVIVENQGTLVESFDVTLVSNFDGTIQTLTATNVAAGGGTAQLVFTWTVNINDNTLATHTLTATAAHGADGGTDSNAGNDSANYTNMTLR